MPTNRDLTKILRYRHRMKFYMWTSEIHMRHHLQCRRPWFDSWVGKIPWRRNRQPTPVFLGFPGGSDGKESTCNVGDLGSIPGLGRSPGGGHGNPLQYSILENPHGRRSLMGRWGHKNLGVTEWLSTHTGKLRQILVTGTRLPVVRSMCRREVVGRE